MYNFTFIIPAYNAEDFIDRCVSSILSQSYTNYEVIIINDGSTDNTGTIIDSYARYENFTILHQENQGHSIARNNALKIAKGEYIWFIDSDDYLYNSEILDKVNNDIINYNKPDIAIYSVLETDLNKKTKKWLFSKKPRYTNINDYSILFLKQNWVWNKIINFEFLKSTAITFEDRLMFEDQFFICDLYPKTKTLFVSNEIAYVYIKHSEALTASIKNYGDYPYALYYAFKSYLNVVFTKKK